MGAGLISVLAGVALLLPGTVAAANAGAAGQDPTLAPGQPFPWARGIEGQRKADLGDGTFLNPVIPGDHRDPAILREGDRWYATFSSFETYPGLLLWTTKDLVNWTPVAPTLTHYVGAVWAPDLIKHDGRYYIYFPARTDSYRSNYVIWADRIEGPWSAPIDLKLPQHIDPTHGVAEDGSRWLFLSGGDRIRLSDDGLGTVGKVEHVLDPWTYPEEWDVESLSHEGPTLAQRDGWYYQLYAGVGVKDGAMVLHRYGRDSGGRVQEDVGNRLFLRLRNDRHIVRVDWSRDGEDWRKYPVQWEVSGYHHNTAGDFLALKPALYAAGAGAVTFKNFQYRGLP